MKVQNTTTQDLDGIEAVEYNRYAVLYAEKPEKKRRFRKTLEKRLLVANKWMWVVKNDEKVLGSLSAQPTSKNPQEFKSWEESTNNGTLEGTYDENGQNVYVVNLDVLQEGTKKGAQYMLMAYLAAKVLEDNKRIVFFESRMPGFREYIVKDKKISIGKWESLNKDAQDELATEYSKQKITVNGKLVPRDKLLKFYQGAGFKRDNVVANAFDDPESLNYGLVFYANNDLPRIVRMPLIRNIVASIIRLSAKNPKILDLIIR